MDSAKKQYWIFAAILALIASIFLNFTIIGSAAGPFVEGFPISVYQAEGGGVFFSRLINSVVMGLLLVVPMYYLLNWIFKKATGGYGI
jgi:asparagine N-glycosylation enzyme membrane subunit Stt3